MKNYLVFYLFKSKHASWKATMRDEYVKFNEFAIQSYKDNLVGLDEIVVFDDEVEYLTDAFKLGFHKIYDMWKSEKCNIMFCGVDTYCFKKVDIFDKFENFMMFNYSDPSTYMNIENYFNCDVRIFPHTMKQEAWDVGLKMSENWDSRSATCNGVRQWDYEQYILNNMLWSPENGGMSLEDCYRPDLAWQDVAVKNNNGGIPITEASIVHFHGTRQIDTIKAKVEGILGGS